MDILYEHDRSEAGMTKEEKHLLHAFPKLTAKELEKVNELYKHYVFIKNRGDGWEISTSCCHRDKEFTPHMRQLETPEEWELFSRRHNEEGVCPYCGRPVTFKIVGKCGRFANLRENHCVVFWHYRDGAVFAQCYWTRKEYSQYSIAGEVGYILSCAYAFLPGKVYCFSRDGYGERKWCVEKMLGGVGKRIAVTEPFPECNLFSSRVYEYADIGREQAIDNSFFKYSQFWKFEGAH